MCSSSLTRCCPLVNTGQKSFPCCWDAWQLLERRHDEHKQVVAGVGQAWGTLRRPGSVSDQNSPCHSSNNGLFPICLPEHICSLSSVFSVSLLVRVAPPAVFQSSLCEASQLIALNRISIHSRFVYICKCFSSSTHNVIGTFFLPFGNIYRCV